MEIGTEIGQKIRSAIKAKLMELGAYVDDELPDYIMVMVANKRSRVQMKNDLGLFLGGNTDSFTGWLHALLAKLQAFKSEHDKQGNAESLGAVIEKKKVGKLQKGKIVKKKLNKAGGELNGLGKAVTTSSDRKLGETHTTSFDVGCGVSKGDDIVTESMSPDKQFSKNIPDTDKQNQSCLSPEVSVHGLPELHTIKKEVVDSRSDDLVGSGKSVATFKADNLIDNNFEKFSIAYNSSVPQIGVNSLAIVRKRRASTSALDQLAKRRADEVYNLIKFVPGDSADIGSIAASHLTASSQVQINRHTDCPALEARYSNIQTCHQEAPEQPSQKHLILQESVKLEDIKQALVEVLERSQSFNDNITHFCKMLESSLRKLHPQDFSLAKLRFQQILYELESRSSPDNNVDDKVSKHIPDEAAMNNSNCNNERTYFQPLETNSDIDSIRVSGYVRRTFSSPHTPPGSPPSHDTNQSSDQIENLSALDQQIDNADINHQTGSSFNSDNYVPGKYISTISEQPSHFQSNSTLEDLIHCHKKSTTDSLKPTLTYKKYTLSEYRSKILNRDKLKSSEKESDYLKPQQREQQQSPLSSSKTDIESPNSTHSSPVNITSRLNINRHVTSASRESTLSPLNQQTKPGSSHVHKLKSTSTKTKSSPLILVDSIHSRKRPESVESSSVLRQTWHKDKSSRPADATNSDILDSPKHYGPEALKVMAKNLKITVINKRAIKSPQESSTEDSDDDDDEDDDLDSSNNEDDERERKTKQKIEQKRKTANKCPS